jgi:DNA repair protein RadD
MLLRPRQRVFVERSLRALDEHGETLGVGPTGCGKTIMLSAVVGKALGDSDARACVLAHRDELTAQNQAKFRRGNPGLTTSVVDAREKSWAGRTVFAMVPTLARAANLAAMPALDVLVIDNRRDLSSSTASQRPQTGATSAACVPSSPTAPIRSGSGS